MAHSKLQRAAVGPVGRTGIAGAALLLVLAGFTGGAWAQAKKEKAPAEAPAADAAAQSAWVKLCQKMPFVGKDKEGKEEKKDLTVCVTQHERIDANTGFPNIFAGVRQVEGQPKLGLSVMVPLGVAIQPGLQAAVYPKDLWEKVGKGEKIDETKLKPMRLNFAFCHQVGCQAEAEATPELVGDMKTGGGIGVVAFEVGGRPVFLPIPLIGFDATFAGAPVDNEQYAEARRKMMQQLALRHQQMVEEQKKQNDDLQKMQGNDALKGTKAPPAKKEKDKDK